MAIVQNLEDSKFLRVLYDNSSTTDLGIVTNFYEVPPFIQTDFHMLVQFNDNILIEVDIARKENISESTLSTFMQKLKSDEKSKFLKFEYNPNTKDYLTYHVLVSLLEKKNPKMVWRFPNENIITLKFRPKNPNYNSEYTYQYRTFKNSNLSTSTITIPPNKAKVLKENHLAISLSSNRVCVFHYETKSCIASFKSYYGSILALEYSFDGRLLAMGTESDQIYIADPEYNVVLYCLEGHKNFVTNLTFFEEANEEDEAENIDQNNYESNKMDTKVEYNTNNLQGLVTNKEMSLEEMSKILTLEETKSNLDIRMLRRARSSLISKIVESDDMKTNITYDLFSSGMDGIMAIWRVELFFDQNYINEANYCFTPTVMNNSITNPIKLIELFPHENLKIPYTSLTKISTIPIILHYIDENCLFILCKKNAKGTAVSFKYFYGNSKIEEDQPKETTSSNPKDEFIVNKPRRESAKPGSDKKEQNEEKSNSAKKDKI